MELVVGTVRVSIADVHFRAAGNVDRSRGVRRPRFRVLVLRVRGEILRRPVQFSVVLSVGRVAASRQPRSARAQRNLLRLEHGARSRNVDDAFRAVRADGVVIRRRFQLRAVLNRQRRRFPFRISRADGKILLDVPRVDIVENDFAAGDDERESRRRPVVGFVHRRVVFDVRALDDDFPVAAEVKIFIRDVELTAVLRAVRREINFRRFLGGRRFDAERLLSGCEAAQSLQRDVLRERRRRCRLFLSESGSGGRREQ